VPLPEVSAYPNSPCVLLSARPNGVLPECCLVPVRRAPSDTSVLPSNRAVGGRMSIWGVLMLDTHCAAL